MSQLVLETKIQSESEALQLVADTIKRPPTTAQGIIEFAIDNFKLSGTINKAVESLLPFASSVLPFASGIFSAFAGIGAPTLGEQIFDGFNKLSNQISAEFDDLKNYLSEMSEAQTAKIIDITLQGVATSALEESAVRSIVAIYETNVRAEFQAERDKLFTEYSERIKTERAKAENLVSDYIQSAREQVNQAYLQAEALLADKVMSLLRQLETAMRSALDNQNSLVSAVSQSRSLPPALPVPQASEANYLPVIIAGIGGIALFAMSKRKKN